MTKIKKRKVLIADDEKDITDIIAYNLLNNNFDVVRAYDGQQAFEIFQKEDPDLVLLDVMMPKADGFEVCQKIREESQVPIIMLTARADEADKILGLDCGADDYVTKPFSVKELVARVCANMRRAIISSEPKLVAFGRLKVDFNRNEVVCNNKTIQLTPKEFELLKFLVNRPEKIFTRDELLNYVWKYEYYGDARTVDVTIRRLRTKIEKVPDKPEFILTRRGVGYYFSMNNHQNNN